MSQLMALQTKTLPTVSGDPTAAIHSMLSSSALLSTSYACTLVLPVLYTCSKATLLCIVLLCQCMSYAYTVLHAASQEYTTVHDVA
jgi:hypothetical protein